MAHADRTLLHKPHILVSDLEGLHGADFIKHRNWLRLVSDSARPNTPEADKRSCLSFLSRPSPSAASFFSSSSEIRKIASLPSEVAAR